MGEAADATSRGMRNYDARDKPRGSKGEPRRTVVLTERTKEGRGGVSVGKQAEAWKRRRVYHESSKLLKGTGVGVIKDRSSAVGWLRATGSCSDCLVEDTGADSKAVVVQVVLVEKRIEVTPGSGRFCSRGGQWF